MTRNEAYNKVMGVLEDFNRKPADEWSQKEIDECHDIIELCIQDLQELEVRQ